MAEWLGDNEYLHKPQDAYKIIRMTIDALATDGLGVTNRGDLGQILPEFEGSSREGYKQVDNILKNFLLLKNEAAMTPNVIKALNKMVMTNPVVQRHLSSQFKRDWPITIKRDRILDNI
jgi:hypothetical protein